MSSTTHRSTGGAVEKWLDDKGYGFTTQDGGGHGDFLHACFVAGSEHLEPGMAVQYEVEYDERRGKYHAVSCAVLGSSIL